MPEIHADRLIAIGEQLDRIMTCDLRARPYILPMYKAALDHRGRPLSLAAGQLLSHAIRSKKKPVVVIVTGFASVSLGVGEQDGPVGAVYLGRTLAALGALPVFVTDEHQFDLMRQAIRGGGLNVISLDMARKAIELRPSVSTLVGWPADPDVARRRTQELLQDLEPVAMVAIERPGANELGACHQLSGLALDLSLCSDTDVLWAAARAAKIPCIGIGDAGNELGMGVIRPLVEHWLGDRKSTANGGSIAAVQEADVTILSAVSNWGAYATAAAVACVENRPEILPSEETVKLSLIACSLAGARNGFNDYIDPGADGYPIHIEAAVVTMMTTLSRSI